MPRPPCSDLPPVHGSPQCQGIHPTQGRRRDHQQEDRVAALVCLEASRDTCSVARISARPDLPRNGRVRYRSSGP